MKSLETRSTLFTSFKAALLIFLSLLGLGCGDTAARQLAGQTVQSIDSYEAEVNKKLQAENNFYAVEKENIQERLFGCPACAPPVPVLYALYYNDLLVSSQRDSLILAEQFVAAPTKGITSATINFVSAGLSGESQLYTGLVEREQQLDIDLGQNVTKLQSTADELSTVRTQATLLASKPGAVSQLNSLYQLGAGVSDILQKNKAAK